MNKYRNVKTIVDGITFASKREANRYTELKLMEKAKVISDLELQPKFLIEFNGVKICTYYGDFRYAENGKSITEDCKGVKTRVYIIKKKLVKAFYNVEIQEI